MCLTNLKWQTLAIFRFWHLEYMKEKDLVRLHDECRIYCRSNNYSIICYIYGIKVIKYTIILVICVILENNIIGMKLNRIKAVLVERDKSQLWLAEQIGKSFSTVNAYCCNRQQPSLEILDKVAECLKVDMKELILERSERDSLNLE